VRYQCVQNKEYFRERLRVRGKKIQLLIITNLSSFTLVSHIILMFPTAVSLISDLDRGIFFSLYIFFFDRGENTKAK